MWFRAPHLTHPHFRCHPRRHRQTDLRRHLQPASIPYPYTSGTGRTSVQTRTVHTVFQYAAATPNAEFPVLNTRFVRHHFDLELYPSLRLEARACRSPHAGVRDLLINLQLHNELTKSFNIGFELTQISCASRFWTVSTIASPDSVGTTCIIEPEDTISLYLTASPISPVNEATDPAKVRDNGQMMFSSVVLDRNRTAVSTKTTLLKHGSPWADFYFRSGVNWRIASSPTRRSRRQLESQDHLDITLIVMWKVRPDPVTLNDEVPMLGQSHVSIRRIGHSAFVPLDDQSGNNERTSSMSTVLTPEVLSTELTPTRSPLARLRLLHPNHVHSDWPESIGHSQLHCSSLASRSPLAMDSHLDDSASIRPSAGHTKRRVIIPVKAEVYNCSSFAIAAILEAKSPDDHEHEETTVNPGSMQHHANSMNVPFVHWVGLVRQRFEIHPNQSHTIRLEARVVRPGCFSTGNLILKAGPVTATNMGDLPRQPTVPTFITISSVPH